MLYKGYVGSVELSENDGVFCGKVQGVQSLISYEGKSVQEFVDDFHKAVDDYLALCEAEGSEPAIAKDGDSMQLPYLEITQQVFCDHIEDEDFFLVYGNPVILRADSGTKLLCISYPMYERLVALAECGEELPPPLGRFLPKKSD